MKKIIIALLVICKMAVISFAELRSSIEQYGITWTFDGSYECGQFVNGDYWVVGPITVVSVSPAPKICTVDERGFNSWSPNGYLWWDSGGEFWCVSAQVGSASGSHWRRYNENIVGLYTPNGNSPGSHFDTMISEITQYFENYEGTGRSAAVYIGNGYADDFESRGRSVAPYFPTGNTYNGRPTYEAGFVFNGSVVNLSVQRWPFDSTGPVFQSNLIPQFPLLLEPDSSLMSAKSYDYSGYATTVFGHSTSITGARSVETIAILTVLAEAPPADSFRPPYFGANKPIYRLSDIDWNKLPKVLPPQYIENKDYDFEDIGGVAIPARDKSKGSVADQYSRYYKRPQIVHMAGYTDGWIQPPQHTSHYHEYHWRGLSEVAALLCCDLDSIYNTSGELQKLAIPIIQMGIDAHYVGINENTRHFGYYTCRWPTLFAGVLLGKIQEFSPVHRWHSGAEYLDKTERQIYYVGDTVSNTPSSIVAGNSGKPFNNIYTGYRVPSSKSITGREQVVAWTQHTGSEYEHLYPSEWPADFLAESYRRMNSSGFIGLALSAHLMDFKIDWGAPEFFDYVYRWMNEDMAPFYDDQNISHRYHNTNYYQSSTSKFIDSMWHEYYALTLDGSYPEHNIENIISSGRLVVINNVIKGTGAQASIKLLLAEPRNASVKIYDSKGREIITLWDGHKDAGEYNLHWDGKDSSGKKVGSGVYMVHMQAGSYKETKKIVVVR